MHVNHVSILVEFEFDLRVRNREVRGPIVPNFLLDLGNLMGIVGIVKGFPEIG